MAALQQAAQADQQPAEATNMALIEENFKSILLEMHKFAETDGSSNSLRGW